MFVRLCRRHDDCAFPSGYSPVRYRERAYRLERLAATPIVLFMVNDMRECAP